MRVACFTTTDRNKWLNRLNVDCNRRSGQWIWLLTLLRRLCYDISGSYTFRIPLEMILKLSTIEFI